MWNVERNSNCVPCFRIGFEILPVVKWFHKNHFTFWGHTVSHESGTLNLYYERFRPLANGRGSAFFRRQKYCHYFNCEIPCLWYMLQKTENQIWKFKIVLFRVLFTDRKITIYTIIKPNKFLWILFIF
jgi:hypothetical protein